MRLKDENAQIFAHSFHNKDCAGLLYEYSLQNRTVDKVECYFSASTFSINAKRGESCHICIGEHNVHFRLLVDEHNLEHGKLIALSMESVLVDWSYNGGQKRDHQK